MSAESTNFLYPFIDAEERDPGQLLQDLSTSAQKKMVESRTFREAMLVRYDKQVAEIGAKMAARFAGGGRLFTFGNGGSATDAAGAVELFRDPLRGRPLAAMSLVDDRAVLTALANDIGTEVIFSRQIIAHARAGDIAVGFSTSGDSANVLRALEEARRRAVLAIGFAGYAGGAMGRSEALDHCFVAVSDSVHRIQEAQDALILALWSAVQEGLMQGAVS